MELNIILDRRNPKFREALAAAVGLMTAALEASDENTEVLKTQLFGILEDAFNEPSTEATAERLGYLISVHTLVSTSLLESYAKTSDEAPTEILQRIALGVTGPEEA